ncbi:hypothetical protein AAC387_Pa03g0492 [Persea americana]
MEWPPVLLFFVFHLRVYGCFGCSHAERSALLELKSSMNLPTDLVTSWGIGHCCSWDIVRCNSSTGRVIELKPPFQRFFDADLGDWYLNASLLLPFDELRSLDLSSNKMKGLIDEQAFKRWSRVSKLGELILGFNTLNNTILPYVGAFKFLKILDVGHNKFQGPLPTEGLCKLKNLQELDLSFNEFEGAIPYCLGSLTSLQRLQLSYNQFSGKIAMLSIANLTSLVEFSVTNNSLSGLVTLSSFAHLSKLEDFDLSNNDLEVETEYPPWNATFQLKSLRLSNCRLNKHTGDNAFLVRGKEAFDEGHPDGLYPYVDYEVTGELTRVEFITKHILNSYNGGLLKFMSGIDFSCNQLAGEIPLELGQLSGLHSLNLSYNQLSGPIPTTFNNLTQIESLDLSFNRLNGTIPSELIELYYLAVFSVAHNNLSGSTPAMKFQFATFNESSYVGNPLLCGLPLNKSCISTTPTIRAPKEDEDDDDNGLVYFYASFIGSYSVFLLGTIAVLYFTSQRRAVCFLYIVDSWCAFRLYKLYRLFSWKLSDLNIISMECPQVLCFWVLVFGFQLLLCGGFGCFEKEKSALLELKLSINHPNGTSFPSWGGGTDCCTWDGVTCNSRTARVIELDLSGSMDTDLGDWYLNASLLLPLEKLQSLVLNFNSLTGFIDGEAIETLTSLRTIDFAWNGFNDPQSIQGFCKLKGLQRLDLSYNYFKGPIPLCLGNLKSLQLLNLSNNGFSGMLPTSTNGNDESQGPLPIKGLCKFKDIKWLDLSFNHFEGSIPSCLGNFSNLQLLDLSNNGFSGKIPASTFSNVTSLSYLSLAKNNFSGIVEFRSFAHLSKLKEFVLSYNDLEVETEYLMLNSTFQLTVLGLSNCKLNKDTGSSIPNFLYNQQATNGLRAVAFITKRMENYYKGGILNYMSGIDVSCNQLTGEIPREMGQLSGLHSMNLSYNQFAGPIPATFKNLSQIESLDLSHNKLNGTIPPELVELNYLAVFSVAHNNLSGRIPDMKSQFSTFTESSYEGNPLLCGPPLSRSCISTAPISEAPEEDEIEDDDDIVSFYCSFAGSYLVFLMGTIGVLYFISQRHAICFLYVVDSCNLSKLQLLELSNNRFSGKIPASTFSNVTSLSYLSLAKNNFSGKVEFESFAHLSKLKEFVLSYNDLEVETEYPRLNFTVLLTALGLSNCQLSGILNYMSGIDVSCNLLTGEIPREMGQLSELHSMNLSYNQFAGPIPATFKNLSQIESLDLSHNKLNGTIPPELIELNYLAVFSVAHNNLSGKIPDKSQFSTFNESSYEGNPLLCGPPLSRSCISTTPISEAPEKDENEDDDNIVSFYCSFAGSYLVFLIGTIGVLYFISQRRAMCFLYAVDSWCAFRLYKLYELFGWVKVDESISTVANERKYEGVDCGGNMGLVECGGWTILDVPTNGSRTTHTRLPNEDSPTTLAIDVTNVYVVAYQTGNRSFFFTEANPDPAILNLFPDTQLYTLPFSGSYIDLERVANQYRETIDPRMEPLENAITLLRISKGLWLVPDGCRGSAFQIYRENWSAPKYGSRGTFYTGSRHA